MRQITHALVALAVVASLLICVNVWTLLHA